MEALKAQWREEKAALQDQWREEKAAKDRLPCIIEDVVIAPMLTMVKDLGDEIKKLREEMHHLSQS